MTPSGKAPTPTPRRPTSIAARPISPDVLRKFPESILSALVTDAAGRGALFQRADRARRRLWRPRDLPPGARDARRSSLGAQVASRVAPRTVIPAALADPARRCSSAACAPSAFRLRTIGELVTPRAVGRARSRWRWSTATAARSAATPRRRARCRCRSACCRGDRRRPDGVPRLRPGRLSCYEFHLLPLANNAIFVVTAAAPSTAGFGPWLDAWGGFAAGRAGARASRCWRSGWAPIAGACGRCATSRTSPTASPAARTSSSRRAAPGRRSSRRWAKASRRWPRRSPAARRSCAPASSSAITCCAKSITG